MSAASRARARRKAASRRRVASRRSRSSSSSSRSSSSRSSSNPNKYKYEYGGRSYENKADATAASRADKGASSSRTNHVAKQSGGGSSPATDAQKAQLAQLQKTLADLQAKKAGGGVSSPGDTVNANYQAALDSRDTSSRGAAPATTYSSPGAKVNAGYAAALAANKGTKIDTSSSIPSTALNSTLTPNDVLKKQKELQGIKDSALSIQDQLNELKRLSTLDPAALDPNETINDYIEGTTEKTDAQAKRDQLLERVSKDTQNFYKDRTGDIDEAYDRFGVDEKQNALAEIQKERADRSVKLRKDIQNLETAPEFRGVSRGFANDQREAIKSKGSFDLANLAIVESAYAGDVNQSRELAQEMIDTQFDEYQGKMEAYKAQLAALAPQLNEDQKRQALQIEIALDNRTRSLEEKKADTELKYEYATAVASLGAPLDVTRSILNATSADEAFMLAAPYMKEGYGETPGSPVSNTRATDVASNAGDAFGETNVYSGMSPLQDTNLNTASNREIEQAFIQSDFPQEWISTMKSSLTQEQLADFLRAYQNQASSENMSPDPGMSINTYMYSIGKEPTYPVMTLSLPPGSFEIDAEDQIRAEDNGKYEIRRVGQYLYAIPQATGGGGGGGERSAF